MNCWVYSWLKWFSYQPCQLEQQIGPWWKTYRCQILKEYLDLVKLKRSKSNRDKKLGFLPGDGTSLIDKTENQVAGEGRAELVYVYVDISQLSGLASPWSLPPCERPAHNLTCPPMLFFITHPIKVISWDERRARVDEVMWLRIWNLRWKNVNSQEMKNEIFGIVFNWLKQSFSIWTVKLKRNNQNLRYQRILLNKFQDYRSIRFRSI